MELCSVPGTAYGSAGEALVRVAPLLAGLLASEVQRRLGTGRYARVHTEDGEMIVLATPPDNGSLSGGMEEVDGEVMAREGELDRGIAGAANRALAAVAAHDTSGEGATRRGRQS